ncbi:ornithine cyclodeaminase family protein [Burkholderia ambifaria]|uniref:ornithine cyclodeaminase family protein n=1 Tax=Burkholderia ambifaria TaxID=152480 RepID=UPI00158C4B1A|nr:ornithine cyclodeaminase family protein [Burkholderia ambifaria]
MRIWTKDEIVARFDAERAVRMVEQGFIAYSRGGAQVPPIQHFQFAPVNGECCIKSAYVEGTATFAVKASSGFYNNPEIGLPSNSGMVMLFSAVTGEPVALLQDEGWLTCVRTAIAGQLAAHLLAPHQVGGIGIIGAGVQARLQLEYLKPVTVCREVHVWERNPERSMQFAADMSAQGFSVQVHSTAEDVARNANLIVTVTPSRAALLQAEWIRDGTHITAVGADAAGKQELDPRIAARAGAVVVDSIEQCSQYGEVSHALSARLIHADKLVEIGVLLAEKRRGRNDADRAQITLADLTGVAVQDAQIAASIVAR